MQATTYIISLTFPVTYRGTTVNLHTTIDIREGHQHVDAFKKAAYSVRRKLRTGDKYIVALRKSVKMPNAQDVDSPISAKIRSYLNHNYGEVGRENYPYLITGTYAPHVSHKKGIRLPYGIKKTDNLSIEIRQLGGPSLHTIKL